MRMIRQKLRKLSAWTLAAALLGSGFGGFVPAKAEAAGENHAAIVSSEELSDGVQAQTSEAGTEQSEIGLPDELNAVLELTAGPSSDSGSEEETSENGSQEETQPQTEGYESAAEAEETETETQEEQQGEEQPEPSAETEITEEQPETESPEMESPETESPDTVTIDSTEYTPESGEDVELPEITAASGGEYGALLTAAGDTDEYGTIVYEGTIGSCTWTLYDTDGDGTEDLLVLGGDTPEHYPGSATGKPPWYDYRENIKRAVVEEGVTGLAIYTFDGCTNLKDVTLPSTLVIIRESAFRRCKSLSSLVIPSGVTEIGSGAFENCNNLVSVMLPDTLKNIEQFAFFQCGLVEIEIPEGVETIGYRAFCQCYSLQSVILPSTLNSIGNEAFYLDSNLTIIIPEGVQTIGNSAFSEAKAVYNLSDCAVTGSSISKKVNYDKITLVENGESSEQRVLPANCVAGSRYANTKYDNSYYYSSGDGNIAWYVKNGDTYEKVTSGTSFQNAPTFYYAKAFDDTTVEAEAAGESGDSYTLVVKDKETGETLTEGMHYTQEMTGSTDWEETDTGSLSKTVTVTITGIAGGGYVGTMQTAFQISAEAEASVTANGNTKKYPAFEEAWEAAQGKKAVVTLLADVQVSATLPVTTGSDITLTSEKDGNGGTYTISGNVLNEESGMIDVAAGGTLTLESGTIENGETGNNAIAVNGGHFVMNGGTAAALADGHSGICVYSGGTVEINGGSASGYNGLAIVDGGSGIISGGTFTGTFSVANESAAILLRRADGTLQTILGKGKAYYEVKDGTKTLITDLTGRTRLYGTVTVEDCTHSCESWTDDGDGEKHSGTCIVCKASMSEPHNWNENGRCTAGGCTAQMAASVTVNGEEPEYYATIEEAWQAAKGHSEGATVTLLADVAIADGLLVVEGDNITLSMAEGVTLTTSDSNGCILVVYGGRLTLESGTLDAGMDFGTDFGEGIRIYGGTFIMNGGTVSGYIGIEQFSGGALDYDGGFAFITNGTISGTMYGFAANGGSTELMGGTFSGPGASIINTKGKISDILGSGYAYQKDGAWVNDTTVTELTGTVIVEEAPIKSVEVTADKTTVIATNEQSGWVTLTAQIELSGNYTDSDVTWKWFDETIGNHYLIADTKEWTYPAVYPRQYTFTCEATCDGYTVTSEPFVLTVLDPNAENISVEVSWGALEYTYTDGSWNPDTHTYKEGEWTADKGGNCITVTNTGNVDVTVTYKYDPSVTSVTGSFWGDDGNLIHSPVALPQGEEKKAYLTLTGKPQTDLNKETLGLGSVTVTIGGK